MVWYGDSQEEKFKNKLVKRKVDRRYKGKIWEIDELMRQWWWTGICENQK